MNKHAPLLILSLMLAGCAQLLAARGSGPSESRPPTTAPAQGGQRQAFIVPREDDVPVDEPPPLTAPAIVTQDDLRGGVDEYESFDLDSPDPYANVDKKYLSPKQIRISNQRTINAAHKCALEWRKGAAFNFHPNCLLVYDILVENCPAAMKDLQEDPNATDVAIKRLCFDLNRWISRYAQWRRLHPPAAEGK